MALSDMEHDRPHFEQGEIALFIGRNLPERMKRTVHGFLHLAERKKTNVVRLAHFFKRPASAHVTRQSLAAIWRPFKGGNGGGHWKAPGNCITLSRVMCVITTIFFMVRYRSSALHPEDERPARLPTTYLVSFAMGFAVRAFCSRPSADERTETPPPLARGRPKG